MRLLLFVAAMVALGLAGCNFNAVLEEPRGSPTATRCDGRRVETESLPSVEPGTKSPLYDDPVAACPD
jgi:hypothetical protein